MTKDGITERDSLDHGAATVLYNVAGDNLTQYDADRYYFIAFNSIYLYSRKTNEAKAVWKTTDLYSANCTLDQIKFENNKCGYVSNSCGGSRSLVFRGISQKESQIS